MPKTVTRFWIAKFTPQHVVLPDDAPRDYFRTFTSWRLLLGSMSRPLCERHPSWSTPHKIFYINIEDMTITEVTAIATTCAITEAPEMDEEEPAAIPHFAIGVDIQ